MRSTRVITPDGKMLAIPNNTVVNSTVASYTNFPHLRLDTAFAVGVAEDLDRIEALLLEMCSADPKVSKSPPPLVATIALNDYNVSMELQLWIDDEREHVELRSHFRRKLYDTLRAANVDMPYETLQIQPIEIRQPAAKS
jgi:small conductance mechanosensitive channel